MNFANETRDKMLKNSEPVSLISSVKLKTEMTFFGSPKLLNSMESRLEMCCRGPRNPYSSM